MMKTIMEPKSTIAKLWSVPKKTEGQTYRLMDYILRNVCEDGTLLYNVVTSEMVLLDPSFDLDSIVPGVYDPAMDELIQHHFVVPADYDEKKSVDQLRVIMRKLNKPKRISGYTIYPTTCCNARCFYCFENNFVKETMTEETAEAVVQYIAEHCGGKGIEITWFGGEPLVGRHIIDYICKRLNEREIPFQSSMVSNAYLFDAEVAKTAVDLWKLKNVQITLDGTEEVYNATKAYQGVTGSPYQRVLDNIDLVLEAGIGVAVRLNVTQENVENLFLLADELKERFAGKKELQVYAHIVYDNVGYMPFEYQNGEKDCLIEKANILGERLVKNRLSFGFHKLPYFKSTHCMADNDESVTIFPNGKLGKCENRSSNDAFSTIWEEFDISQLSLYKKYDEDKICYHCPLYPYCIKLTICPDEVGCRRDNAKYKIAKYSELVQKSYSRQKAFQATSDRVDDKEKIL